MDTLPSESDLQMARHVNSERLNTRVFIEETIFNRAVLDDLRGMVKDAQAGKRPANDVIQFIDPRSRLQDSTSVSPFGLGWTLDQGIKMLEGLEGYDHRKVIPLGQETYKAFENILAAVGLPDPHIARRNEETGRLEHLPFPPYIGDKSDLIETYILKVNRFFDYFENLFDSGDVIKYCQGRMERIQQYLNGGVDRRTGEPLDKNEIMVANKRIKGFQEAIERNKKRT